MTPHDQPSQMAWCAVSTSTWSMAELIERCTEQRPRFQRRSGPARRARPSSSKARRFLRVIELAQVELGEVERCGLADQQLGAIGRDGGAQRFVPRHQPVECGAERRGSERALEPQSRNDSLQASDASGLRRSPSQTSRAPRWSGRCARSGLEAKGRTRRAAPGFGGEDGLVHAWTSCICLGQSGPARTMPGWPSTCLKSEARIGHGRVRRIEGGLDRSAARQQLGFLHLGDRFLERDLMVAMSCCAYARSS